jgi:ethanolamine utilization protein EutP (predicted NTPase)
VLRRRDGEWNKIKLVVRLRNSEEQRQRRNLLKTSVATFHAVVVIQAEVVLLIPVVAVKRSWKRFGPGWHKVAVTKGVLLPVDAVVPVARR